MGNFGKDSERVLYTVSEYLIMAAERTAKRSRIPIAVPPWGGFRTDDYQNKLYLKKWSKADGYEKKSNHQKKDLKGKVIALDLCALVNGKYNFNKERLIYINTLMQISFEELKEEGKIPKDIFLHQGMFWTPNDKKKVGMGWDKPHSELRYYPQTKIYV